MADAENQSSSEPDKYLCLTCQKLFSVISVCQTCWCLDVMRIWWNAYMVYIRMCLIFYNILNSALLFEVSLSCLCEGNAYSIHPHTYFCMYCLLFQVQLIFFSSPDPQTPHQFSRTQDKIRVLQPCKVILECGLHSCAVFPLYRSRQHVAGSIYIFQEILFTTCLICRGIPA